MSDYTIYSFKFVNGAERQMDRFDAMGACSNAIVDHASEAGMITPQPTERAASAWAPSQSWSPLVRAVYGVPNGRKIMGERVWRARSRTPSGSVHQSRLADSALKRSVLAPGRPKVQRKSHALARPPTRQRSLNWGTISSSAILTFAIGLLAIGLVAHHFGYSATVASITHYVIAAATSISYAFPSFMLIERAGSPNAVAGIPRGTSHKAGEQGANSTLQPN